VSQGLPFRIYAHRLGSAYGPESGRSCLEHSLAGGVEGIEADVLISADDRIFALHDPYLSLSTNLEGWADETEASELARACLLDGDGEPSDEHPMELGELLEVVPSGIAIQFDVKAYSDPRLAARTAARVCEELRHSGRAEDAEVLSFFSTACIESVRGGISTRLVAWADYAPEALAKWVKEAGMRGVSLEAFVLSKELCEPLRAAGLTMSIGAVNELEQLWPLLDYEPEIVVSDRPLELRREVERSAHVRRG
jgi:glycerophosphoryl diester phosphodiesterase